MKRNHVFTHPVLGVVSLVIAFFVWLIVMNVSDPVRTKTFASIPVSVSNASYVESKGLSYKIADGFQNISVDLMYDLPGQSREQFRDTLRQVLSLPDPPQHLSAYSLIIEPGTPFWERYHEDAERKALGDSPLFLPSEDEEAGMLSDLKSILSGTGFHRYEISNWALNGFESVHNKGYWERRPYLGFGLGASSQADHMRWKNTSDLNEYLSCSFARKEVTHLSRSNEMEETMFLGLREMKGVTRQHFRERFGVSMDEVYGRVLSNLAGLRLISDDGEAIRLTDRGISISNVVLAEFLLD